MVGDVRAEFIERAINLESSRNQGTTWARDAVIFVKSRKFRTNFPLTYNCGKLNRRRNLIYPFTKIIKDASANALQSIGMDNVANGP